MSEDNFTLMELNLKKTIKERQNEICMLKDKLNWKRKAIEDQATLAENARIRKILQGKIEARRKMFLKELHKDDIIKEMQFLHSLFQQIQPKAEGDENAS